MSKKTFRSKTVGGIVWLVFVVGFIQAKQMIVRVDAPNYQILDQHIPFKGTSIEIAGARPGESYDLLLDEVDLGIVLSSGLKSEIVVPDLEQEKLQAQQFGFYCSYDSLVSIMRSWAQNYPSICRFDSIGQTYEGRWIYGVKVSDNPQIEEDEPEVVLVGMHHAREWASAQAARYFVDTILRNYSTNSEFHNFVNNYQLWVFPILNVDGYVYDYPAQLTWRKNRQPFGTPIGSDPNRDYSGACNGSRMADWGSLVQGSRSSHRPSDEIFMGGFGAWGREVAAFASFFKQHAFVCAVSLHSYSELVLWPYGNGETAPDNAALVSIGQGIAQQIQRLSGGTYTPQQASQLYPTNGSEIDWMYGWAHHIGGFPCMSYVFEIGTAFYQQASQLDAIQREVFKGLWFLYNRADSVIQVLEGMVPRPLITPLDSSATGTFLVHWTPIRPEHNHPDRWGLEELSDLSVIEDSFESGAERWIFQGASLSTTQRHSGSYSVYLGTGNNIANYALTTDPYPVQSGDSLRYWIWYSTENNYDVVVSEVSLEGKEWYQLHNRYTGNSNGWVYKSYSLEDWVGKSVFIRFRYMTDDYTLGSGVYIDDIWPVPKFDSRRTVADDITDTIYEVTVSQPGQYWYRVRGHNATWGWGDQGPLDDIVVVGTGLAGGAKDKYGTAFKILGRNPALSRVDISYSLAVSGPVRIEVFDAIGRKVNHLVEGDFPAGEYQVHWSCTDRTGRKLPAGIYFFRLSADQSITERIVLTR